MFYLSSFADLNSAGARGITFEQAANDIKLSGDIRQIGEVAARIAIYDGQKNSTANRNDVKYDIAYLENGNAFVRANRKVITSSTLEGRRSQITKFFNTLLSQNKTLEIPTIDGDVLTITRDITGDKARDNYKNIKGNRVKLTDDEFLVKLNVETHIDEIAETSRKSKKAPVADAKNHDFAKDGFTYRKAYFEDFDGQYYEITLSVGHNGTVATVYNVGKIEKSVLPSAKIIAGAGSKALGKTLSKDIISTSKDNVNIKPVKGKVTVASGVKLSKGEKAILSKIAKDSGVAVVVERFSGTDLASKGFYSGGIVHLNADRLSEGGFTYTGIHEVVHHLRIVNAEGYKAIESFAKNYYKEKGADLDSEVAKTQAYYKSKGVKLTPEEAMEEIVCNTLSDIATDEDALSAFLGLDSKSQIKFIEVIKTLVRKLKEWANMFLKNTEYHSIVMNDADTLLSLAKQLRAELTKSKQKNTTAENNGVKYNLNENARAEVHKALYDRSYNGEVILRDNTPSIMLAQKGVRDLPMVMKVSHIRENIFTEAEARQQGLKVNKNINYHGLGEDLFLNVLDGLDDVTEAYRGTKLADNSSRRENYFLLISNFTDADGNIINVPVYIEETALSNNVFFDTNKISTVYGKEKLREYIQRQIRDKNLVRIKNRSNVSSESNAPIAEDYRNIASEDSIYKNAKDVNSNSIASFDKNYLSAVESGDMDTAQRFVDEAAEDAMKNSKIRDESGKLAKVYHGSESEDFFEFDKARRGQTDTVSGKVIKRRSFRDR